jgi:hypothetical protein
LTRTTCTGTIHKPYRSTRPDSSSGGHYDMSGGGTRPSARFLRDHEHTIARASRPDVAHAVGVGPGPMDFSFRHGQPTHPIRPFVCSWTGCSTHAETRNERQRLRRRQHCTHEGTGHSHVRSMRDVNKVVPQLHVLLPSSTNPTRPLPSRRHLFMACSHLDACVPDDAAFAESRIRGRNDCHQDVLHFIAR